MMEIREMVPEEAEYVSRIYAKSWKAAYRGIVPQSFLDELSELRWAPKLKDNAGGSFVLLDGETYIGTSCFGRARDEAREGWGEIVSIYLLPEYFGKGYGNALIRSDLKKLRDGGYRNIYLWVLGDNFRARSFYEKNGFLQTEDETIINIGGKDLTEIRYVYRA